MARPLSAAGAGRSLRSPLGRSRSRLRLPRHLGRLGPAFAPRAALARCSARRASAAARSAARSGPRPLGPRPRLGSGLRRRLGLGLGDPDRDPLLDRRAFASAAGRSAPCRRPRRRRPPPAGPRRCCEQRGHAGLLGRRPRLEGLAQSPGSPPRPCRSAATCFSSAACRALAASSLRWIPVSSSISAWAVSNIVVDHCSRVCRSSGELAPTSRATGIRLDCCWYWSRTSRPAIASWASSSRWPAPPPPWPRARSSWALLELGRHRRVPGPGHRQLALGLGAAWPRPRPAGPGSAPPRRRPRSARLRTRSGRAWSWRSAWLDLLPPVGQVVGGAPGSAG